MDLHKEIQKENFYPKNILLLKSANAIGLAISKILQQTNYKIHITSRKKIF